jgi:hypothetical protein
MLADFGRPADSFQAVRALDGFPCGFGYQHDDDEDTEADNQDSDYFFSHGYSFDLK